MTFPSTSRKMTASNRIRNYLSSLNPRAKNSGRTNASEEESNDNGNGRPRNSRSSRSSSAAAAATQQQQQPRRRLQRGWWPDAQKRAERSFKAMEDLREETFVITDNNLEWEFDDKNAAASEPQCHLILPAEIQMNKDKSFTHYNNGRVSNECAICMVEYDLGNVVIASRTCCHAFHQDCILDWVSRENKDCPVCRAVFYDPDGKKKKNRSSRLQNNGDGPEEERTADNATNIIRRSRSDTADTDTLSEFGGIGERRGTSSFEGENDNNNASGGILESVIENEAVEA